MKTSYLSLASLVLASSSFCGVASAAFDDLGYSGGSSLMAGGVGDDPGADPVPAEAPAKNDETSDDTSTDTGADEGQGDDSDDEDDNE